MKKGIPFSIPLRITLILFGLMIGTIFLVSSDLIYEIPAVRDFQRVQTTERKIMTRNLNEGITELFDYGNQTMSRLLQDSFVTDTMLQNTTWNWTQFWMSNQAYTVISSSFFRVKAFGDHVYSVSFQRNHSVIHIGSSSSHGWYRIDTEGGNRIYCEFSVVFQAHQYSLANPVCSTTSQDVPVMGPNNFSSSDAVWTANFVDPIIVEYQAPLWISGSQLPTQPQYVAKVQLRREGLQSSVSMLQAKFPDLTVALVRNDGLILWANRELSEYYGSTSTFYLHESSNPVMNSLAPLILTNSTNELVDQVAVGGRTYTVTVSTLQNLSGYKLVSAYTQDVYLARFYISRTFALFLSCGIILVHCIVSYRMAEMMVGPFSYMIVGMSEGAKLQFRQKRLSTTSVLLELAALQTNFMFMMKTLSQHLVGSTRKRKGGPTDGVRFNIPAEKETAIDIAPQQT
jgi:hypothetical protein